MSLWEEACSTFEERLQKQSEDPAAIRRFLQDQASVNDAKQSVECLRNDSNQKYGSNENQGKGISAKWIRRIMDNLDGFKKFGDVSMQAAPQSVGLVWFAISQTLGAIQNDYKLYGTFNAALNDITEMMVLIRTYDNIYQDRPKQADGSIYQQLYKGILDVYTSILDFSYTVKKHISGGKRSKLVHVFKDVVGSLNREFEEKTTTIATQKNQIVQYAQAAFQERTIDSLGNVSDELSSMQKTVRDAFQFHQQASNEWKAILSELKASNLPSHRDLAISDHEKNMKRLAKCLDTTPSTISSYVRERENGTCNWINEVPEYIAWRDSATSSMLCITGETGSGKSVLGAYICETLHEDSRNDTHSFTQYVSPDVKSSDDKTDILDRIENSLLREVYKLGLDDAADDLLLQRCNELFIHPKQQKGRDISGHDKDAGLSGRSKRSNVDAAPDFLDLYPDLVEKLDKRVNLIIDAVDGLSEADQDKLAEHLIELHGAPNVHVRVLLFCWPSSRMLLKLNDEQVARIWMADFVDADIKTVIASGLQMVPSLNAKERTEIEEAIRQKAGSMIQYVKQVALPFLRTPLRRPVETWLKDLPENVNETYHQHLHQLPSNYRQLLRSALAWTMVAETPARIEEIMDAYSHVYLDNPASDEPNTAVGESKLYHEQLQKAGGPFLDIRSSEYVVLADIQAVRKFCSLGSEIPTEEELDVQLICANCRANMQSKDTITISEKEEHLNMAIICLKHLNASSFQSRFFTPVLAEAKSRALKQDESSNNTSADIAEDAKNRAPGEDLANQDSPAPISVSEPDGKVQAASEAQILIATQDTEVDDDESVFSDQNMGDFEQEYGELEDDESWVPEYRYEIAHWFFHVREAERLWPLGERKINKQWQILMAEIERFFLLEPTAFEAWKLFFVDYSRESWKPLLFAAAYGLTSLAEMLLDNGAKVMDLSPQGWSALHVASEAPNRLEILQLFLRRGGDPNLEDVKIPPFHDWLAFDPDAECVEEFMRSKASCSLKNNKEGQWSSLHYFAQFGTDKAVMHLLLNNRFNAEDSADINVCDGDGETPLHKLLNRQEVPLELLKEFLAEGADVNIDDKASERPLYRAANWGENKTIEAIIDLVTHVDDDNKWGRTALHGAAWSGRHETVQLLIKHGADVNRRDKRGRTPLLYACLPGWSGDAVEGAHRATAELLLEEQIKSGASFRDINVSSKLGRTPLREAAGRGFERVVTTILQKMAPEDKNWLDKRDDRKGRSPLHSAATHGRADVINLLLEHGADPYLRDGVDGIGMTALELCLERWTIVNAQRYERAIARLVEACTDEVKNNKLLLTTAAINGSTMVLEKLANAGVNLKIPDAYGWTPSELASQFGHTGAEAFIRTSLAKTALRPTQWTLKETPKKTTLADEGRRIHHEGDLRMCILADHPVPAGSMYYYEIEILDTETGKPKDSTTQGDEDTAEIAFGFSTEAAKWIDFPGWPPKSNAPNVLSWAYHGDDGAFCSSDRKRWASRFGRHYGPGDTVGCGLDAAAKTIFFTRNGVRLDECFTDFTGRVFPLIGLNDTIQLRTNFGIDPNIPFKWNKHDNNDDDNFATRNRKNTIED